MRMAQRTFLALGVLLPTSIIAAGIAGCSRDDDKAASDLPGTPDGGATGTDGGDGAPADDASIPTDAGVDGDGGQDGSTVLLPEACKGATASAFTPGDAAVTAAGLTVPAGFVIERIAGVPSAREVAALPNGDLLVATGGTSVYLVANADGDGPAGKPTVFATIDDAPVAGITFDGATCTVFVGAQHGVYAIPYQDGQSEAASVQKIANIRSGAVSPESDGNVHRTTSVAVGSGKLYAAAGSSCNACKEVDPTRAAIQEMQRDGSGMAVRATRIRNAIALAANPDTGTIWAGGAGQDDLPKGHPYELFDAVTLHPGVADYGWPGCEENRTPYVQGADCSSVVVPRVVLPAYSTLIGAAYYPKAQAGAHAFPAAQRGFFVTARGSWHKTGNVYSAPPRVVLVPMDGDTPKIPVDWSDPTKQWTEFVGGFEPSGTTRIGRPTGIAVGARGSLLIGDDHVGAVYRVRPQ